MIIYKKDDKSLEIPCGLGPNVCEEQGHELQMKHVDSSTELQHVEADSSYYGLYRVIIDPYELDAKTVDPSTVSQTVTSDKDGLSRVTVNAVTAGIDPDLLAENIKKDVEILGVTGTFEGGSLGDKTVNSSTVSQTVTPDSSDYGLSSVTVNPYTLENVTVDSSTVSQTLTPSADGFSSLTVNPYTLDSKTVNPSINAVTVTSDEDGLSSVTVNAITAAIDPDLVPGNIKKDVEILGVTGTFEGGALQSKTVNSSTVSQTVSPDGTNYGLSSVTVNPYSVESQSETITQNGQYSFSPEQADALSGVSIDVQVAGTPAVIQTKSVAYTANGTYTVTKDAGYDGMNSVDISVNVDNNIDLEPAKTVNSSTVSQTVTYDGTQYDGLSSVTVNPYTLENKTVDSSTVQQTISATNADGLAQVTVEPYTLDSKTVNSSTVSQTVVSSNDGLSSVTVNPYTLGDVGVIPPYGWSWSAEGQRSARRYFSSEIAPDYDGMSEVRVWSPIWRTAYINPSTAQQIIRPSDVSALQGPCEYIGKVQVNAVTAAIDSNITAGNIKDGVTILGVTGTYTGSGGDWVLDVRNGVITDASNKSLTAGANSCYNHLFDAIGTLVTPPVIADTNLSYHSAYYFAFNGTGISSMSVSNLTSVTAELALAGTFEATDLTTASFPSLTTVTGERALQQAFLFCDYLASVSFPSLTTVSGEAAMYQMCRGDESLSSISFPELTTISGDEAMREAFYETAVTSASFPELTTISGTDTVYGMFGSCQLATLSIPKLETIGANVDLDSIVDDPSCITTLTAKPVAVNELRNVLQGLVHLTLTGDIDELDLQYSPALDASSVYEVLTHLDANATNKTVMFYYGGLTVTDFQDGRIQTAYNVATVAGWTIDNLTILPGTPQYTTLTKITTNNDTIPLDFGTPSVNTAFGIDIEFISYPSSYVDFIVASSEGNPDYVAIEKSGSGRKIYAIWGSYTGNQYIQYDNIENNLRFSNLVIGCDSSGYMGFYYKKGMVTSQTINPSPVSGVTASADLTIGASTVSMDVYGISMYTNYDFTSSHTGTLAYNLVPTLNNWTGKYGLYDTVHDVFYPCANGNATGTV